MKVKSLSRVRPSVTPWTAAFQAPPSMGFSSQEYCRGVPLPSPMTNLDSILKSRHITLPTKVHLVKAMVFPVVMYGCESWTIKKIAAAAAAKSLQSCPTLCDPIDGSPPGSAVPGILQARTLEWVAISFSNA